jgi:hypothetical protein
LRLETKAFERNAEWWLRATSRTQWDGSQEDESTQDGEGPA